MDIKKLKKVELHCHLEGATRFSTLVELAKSKNLSLPYDSKENLKKALCTTQPMKNLKEVLDRLFMQQGLLDSTEIYERITFEYCEDSYLNGVRLLELRYSPFFACQGHPNLNFENVHSAILKGIKRAQSKYKIGVGVIGILGRILPLRDVEMALEFIIGNKDSFVGIDLADNEDGFAPKPFSPYFEKAKSEGLHITVHAGELNKPGAENNVVDSIEYLYAERIGHGIRIIQNKKVMDLVKSKGVVLEVCPISNWLTNAVDGGHAHHPIRKLMEYGVPVTINSDDPGLFGTTLLDEYEILKKYHHFTEQDFDLCNQTAYQACFIPNKEIYWE